VGRQLSDDGLWCPPVARQGEEHSGGADKSSMPGRPVWSNPLLGAIYVEHGITVAREVILRIFSSLAGHRTDTQGWRALTGKSSLQELKIRRITSRATVMPCST